MVDYGRDYMNAGKYKSFEDFKKVIYKHAQELSKHLRYTIIVNEMVFRSLRFMYEKFGIPYCPCKLERVEKNICPCEDHVKDLIEKGRCHCGLFEKREK